MTTLSAYCMAKTTAGFDCQNKTPEEFITCHVHRGRDEAIRMALRVNAEKFKAALDRYDFEPLVGTPLTNDFVDGFTFMGRKFGGNSPVDSHSCDLNPETGCCKGDGGDLIFGAAIGALFVGIFWIAFATGVL